ncbi:FCP1 homology domain [Dillenia turbinata]|uniref:FCP1 homology domain n=1 Tax=Dillenia turbinata TaxID=194707 RepID=A0AAN8W7C4_9MAGN
MPTVKMKNKLVAASTREGYGLHVCCMSSKICKSSCLKYRTSDKPGELKSLIETSQYVASKEESLQELESEEAFIIQNFLREDLPVSDKQLVSHVGKLSAYRIESAATAPHFSLKSLCSRILESEGAVCIENMHDNTGVDNGVCDMLQLTTNGDSCWNEFPLDHQTSSLPYSCLSEINDTGSLLNPASGCDDFLNSPVLEFCEPYMSDASGRIMILPPLEEVEDTIHKDLTQSPVEHFANSNDPCFLGMDLRDQKFGTIPHSSDLDRQDCFNPDSFIGNMPDSVDVVSNMLPLSLPKERPRLKPITLALDLDGEIVFSQAKRAFGIVLAKQPFFLVSVVSLYNLIMLVCALSLGGSGLKTLIHSTMDQCDDAAFTFRVLVGMKEITVYVRQRPFLMTFLKRVAEMFEIVVFTASQRVYAEKLLNVLDPERKFISYSFYRDSCTFSDGIYTKDLTILGVDLAKVAIVDNSPQVFRFHVDNGIPIKSWFDDPSDCELMSLIPFLETLVEADDVRPIIAKRFGNKE